MLSPLRWLGRQGTRAVAVVILLAIAVPPLGKILRPYVAGAVFFLLVIAFLRVDPVALLGHLRRPGLALAATIWTSVAIPLLLGGGGMAAVWRRISARYLRAYSLELFCNPLPLR